jgi:hypothetical protein
VLAVLEEVKGGTMHWKFPQLTRQGFLFAIILVNLEINVGTLLFHQLQQSY